MSYGVLVFFLTDTLSSCEKHTLLHAYRNGGRATKQGPNIYKSAKPLLSYRSVCVVNCCFLSHVCLHLCWISPMGKVFHIPLLLYRSFFLFFVVFYHMFAFIFIGYHQWEKFFFTYHCDDATMDYNTILLK